MTTITTTITLITTKKTTMNITTLKSETSTPTMFSNSMITQTTGDGCKDIF